MLLGLALGTLLLASRRDVSLATLARIGIGGAVVASTLLLIAPFTKGPDLEEILPETGHPLTASGRAHKEASMALRLGAWRGTLLLLADQPSGVGAGNFEHAFIPYQLATTPTPNESLWFRSPHNELLRLAIEEGIPVAVLLLLLLFTLVRRAWYERATVREVPWLLSGGGLLLTQCTFQFPLETACGALFAALWLALLVDPALAKSMPMTTGVGKWSRGVIAVVASGAVAVGSIALHRSANANALFGRGRGEGALTLEACRLEPQNLAACVGAAWLQSAHGRPAEAEHLAVEILRHSPHYYPAIKLLGELRLANGDRETGCLDLALYERLFAGRGLASRLLDRYCPPDARPRSRTLVPSALLVDLPQPHWRPGRLSPMEGSPFEARCQRRGTEAVRPEGPAQCVSQREMATEAKR